MAQPTSTYVPDDDDERDLLRKAPVLSPVEVIVRSAAGEDPMQMSAPSEGGSARPDVPTYVQEPLPPRSPAGEAPTRERGSEALMRRLAHAGALSSTISGGQGLWGAVGAGLAQGGAQGLADLDETYALQLQGWQQRMRQIAEGNAGVRQRNADRRFDVRQFERETRAEAGADRLAHERSLKADKSRAAHEDELERGRMRLKDELGREPTYAEITDRMQQDRLREQARARAAGALASKRRGEAEGGEGPYADLSTFEMRRRLDEITIKADAARRRQEAVYDKVDKIDASEELDLLNFERERLIRAIQSRAGVREDPFSPPESRSAAEAERAEAGGASSVNFRQESQLVRRFTEALRSGQVDEAGVAAQLEAAYQAGQLGAEQTSRLLDMILGTDAGRR